MVFCKVFYRLFSYIPVFLYLKLFMIFPIQILICKIFYKVLYEVFYRASTRYSMWYSIGLIKVYRGTVRYQDEYGKAQDFKSLLFTSAEFTWNLIPQARAETKKRENTKNTQTQSQKTKR